MTDSITKTVFLKAPKATVWAFLTEKDKLARWFHPAEDDLADGQDYALLGDSAEGGTVRQCWGTVQHWEPPTRLVYSFTVKPLNGAMTTVTWTLDEMDGGTRLTLLHEGVGVAGDAAFGLLTALDKGWDEHFGRLRGVASI
ncbi:MAG: SRPBCC family protein [Geminicoccaceae bacterium]